MEITYNEHPRKVTETRAPQGRLTDTVQRPREIRGTERYTQRLSGTEEDWQRHMDTKGDQKRLSRDLERPGRLMETPTETWRGT